MEEKRPVEIVRAALAAWGAPLNVSPGVGERPALERVLVAALEQAHTDSTILKILPVVLLKNRDALDLDAVEREATREGRLAEWGMLLDLTGDIANEGEFSKRARALLPRVGRVERGSFFVARSRGEEMLARKRTPESVRRWGYSMNMSEDIFRAAAEKFA